MQLIVHLGAHGLDADALSAWMVQNDTAFKRGGTAVAAPRDFLSQLSRALRDVETPPETREQRLLSALGADGADRFAVSAPGVLGSVGDVLGADGFYQRDVTRRLFGLHSLFPGCRFVFLLTIAPASRYVPRALAKDSDSIRHALPALQGDGLPWSRVARAIKHQFPGDPLLVWRHGDLPVLWPRILGVISGENAPIPPRGLLDIAAASLNNEGRFRLQRYLQKNPTQSAQHLRHVVQSFERVFPAQSDHGGGSGLDAGLADALEKLDAGFGTEWADIQGMRGVIGLTSEDGGNAR